MTIIPTQLLGLACGLILLCSTARAEEAKTTITHAFLATGGETYIRDGDGKISYKDFQ